MDTSEILQYLKYLVLLLPGLAGIFEKTITSTRGRTAQNAQRTLLVVSILTIMLSGLLQYFQDEEDNKKEQKIKVEFQKRDSISQLRQLALVDSLKNLKDSLGNNLKISKENLSSAFVSQNKLDSSLGTLKLIVREEKKAYRSIIGLFSPLEIQSFHISGINEETSYFDVPDFRGAFQQVGTNESGDKFLELRTEDVQGLLNQERIDNERFGTSQPLRMTLESLLGSLVPRILIQKDTHKSSEYVEFLETSNTAAYLDPRLCRWTIKYREMLESADTNGIHYKRLPFTIDVFLEAGAIKIYDQEFAKSFLDIKGRNGRIVSGYTNYVDKNIYLTSLDLTTKNNKTINLLSNVQRSTSNIVRQSNFIFDFIFP